MHPVSIPLDAMVEGGLPPVCLMTGAREGVQWRKVNFAWYPRWIGLLALPALLVAAIVAAVMTKRARGVLPFTPQGYRSWKLAQAAWWVAFIFAVVGVIAGIGVAIAGSGREWWGMGLIVLAVLAPIAVYLLVLRTRQVRVVRIDDVVLEVELPSEEAARALRDALKDRVVLTLGSSRAIAQDAQRSMPAPVGAVCAAHPAAPATWACGRCGGFLCAACERRHVPTAQPLCASCFGLKAQQALPQGLTRSFQVWAGVASLVALFPGCWVVQVPALILNVVGLLRPVEPEVRATRWTFIVGLVLSGLGMLMSVGLFLLGLLSGSD